jgi:hypothetical protein
LPEAPSPKTPVNFKTAIREFSNRLDLANPEKLADFIRKLVNGVVGHLKLPPSKRVSADQARYLLGVANRISSDYELAVIPNGKSAKKDQRKNGSIITLGMKVGDYKGPPDKSGKLLHVDQLPPFVDRKQMVVNEFMVGASSVWMSTSRLVREVAYGNRSFFVLDMETVAKAKKNGELSKSSELENKPKPSVSESAISSPSAVAAETSPHPSNSPAESTASPADPLPSPTLK